MSEMEDACFLAARENTDGKPTTMILHLEEAHNHVRLRQIRYGHKPGEQPFSTSDQLIFLMRETCNPLHHRWSIRD